MTRLEERAPARRSIADIEVALYQGDDLVMMGTIRQVAKWKNVKMHTIYFYLMPSFQRRLSQRKNSAAAQRVIEV